MRSKPGFCATVPDEGGIGTKRNRPGWRFTMSAVFMLGLCALPARAGINHSLENQNEYIMWLVGGAILLWLML